MNILIENNGQIEMMYIDIFNTLCQTLICKIDSTFTFKLIYLAKNSS